MKRKMVWVKNLETGLVWLVDEAHAARLLASGKYERRRAAEQRRGAEGDAKEAKGSAKRKRKGAKESEGAKKSA